jgi:hypothetical protein
VRVVVTGSREATKAWRWQGSTVEQVIMAELDEYLYHELRLAHGAARGVDRIAADVGIGFFAEVRPYPVDTALDGPWPAAGMRRNLRMLDDFRPDMVLAFPRRGPRSARKGTTGCIEAAIERGIEVRVYPVGPE